jgi:hypothetical protein
MRNYCNGTTVMELLWWNSESVLKNFTSLTKSVTETFPLNNFLNLRIWVRINFMSQWKRLCATIMDHASWLLPLSFLSLGNKSLSSANTFSMFQLKIFPALLFLPCDRNVRWYEFVSLPPNANSIAENISLWLVNRGTLSFLQFLSHSPLSGHPNISGNPQLRIITGYFAPFFYFWPFDSLNVFLLSVHTPVCLYVLRLNNQDAKKGYFLKRFTISQEFDINWHIIVLSLFFNVGFR